MRAVTDGSYRNHCPDCLWSLHLDERPGDRQSECRGPMRPVALCHHPAKGFQIVHRCERCGATSANRVAVATEQPDDWALVCGLPAASG